jgi:hypothetical protein
LQRLRYQHQDERWYYRAPNQPRVTQYRHSDSVSLRELVETLRTQEKLRNTATQLEETLDYIRSYPEIWTNRGSRQEPDGPLTKSASR